MEKKYRYNEAEMLVNEMRATAIALDAKIEVLKRRFNHHIDFPNAHDPSVLKTLKVKKGDDFFEE